jgi:CRP/FNR family transcriptional regulator, cyclic AMP receptor protein
MIEKMSTPKTFSPRSHLFREGDQAHSLFLIQSGTVSVRKIKKDGEIEIARIYANEVIGEISFFDKQPRSASAIALTETQATEIKYDVLETAMNSVPPFMKTIMAGLAERLRRADDKIRKLEDTVVQEAPTNVNEKEYSATDVLSQIDDQNKKKD